MGTVAKSSITLTSVSDAYSVSLTPSTCVIHADYDGSNPILTNAYTLISVYCGEAKVPINISAIVTSSNDIQANVSKVDDYTYKLSITDISSAILEGYIDLTVHVNSYATLSARFVFSIERESTMLDWIQDWESNKTTIDGTSIITPKIFVGKREPDGGNVGALTGVYIGPDVSGYNESSAGIYGYKLGKEIFHINETGGSIGGWTINEGGLQSSNGVIHILSEGTIYAMEPGFGTLYWGLFANGSASFANGNVKFFNDGSAEFAGKITSFEGQIGGWTINDTDLYNVQIGLSSINKYVAIVNRPSIPSVQEGGWDGNYLSLVRAYGGVALFYTTGSDYGIIGYNDSSKVFSVGSINYIAGWIFDDSAMWLGTKNDNVNQYTSNKGDITIGTNGLRGCSWYINTDGTASFVKGYVQFNQTYGLIAGWTFDSNAIYTGIKTTSGFTSESGSMTLGTDGIRGYKWKFEKDGSGSIAGGNISWDAEGNVSFGSNVSLAWGNISNAIGNKLTQIDANGIYTGSLTASQVNALTCTFDKGTIGGWAIASDSISKNNIYLGANGDLYCAYNEVEYWRIDHSGSATFAAGNVSFNNDGAGILAGGNISWDARGNVTVNGKIVATSGSIGGFTIGDNRIGSTATASGGGGYLAIYNDFLRVGSTNGYVMFGDDVIPGSYGGMFTATGRIVNSHPNTSGIYGFDQANYGLFINVSGGTKNYGISSDAALKAPAFINTKAKILTFSGSTYSIDFSQYNIILLYYNESGYSGTTVTLPTESSVARQFGLSTLPDDFAAVVTFRVRTGSKNITLKGIYNHNESSQDYEMASGDSVIVLITKVDGFRYQILNHSS